MIGAFARMLGARERVLAVEHDPESGYAVRSSAAVPSERAGRDGPPEAFVAERVSDEGGDVYVIPILEAFRGLFRRKRADGDSSTDVREALTPDNPEGGR